MDRITIPNYEKNLGTEAFIKGDYFEATRHYAKVIYYLNIYIGYYGILIFSKRWSYS